MPRHGAGLESGGGLRLRDGVDARGGLGLERCLDGISDVIGFGNRVANKFLFYFVYS